jgi:hypothetical protein
MTFKKPDAGKPVMLEIAGRKLELRFPLGVLKELEVKEELPMLRGEGLGAAFQNPAKLAVVLYYGLKTKNPDVTQQWVEDNVDSSMLLEYIHPALAFAITGRAPDMAKILAQVPNVERPTEPPTGSPSGPLAGTTSGSVN